MNDFDDLDDDLDELERELGPTLQLALHQAAEAVTDERTPDALWRDHPGPAAPSKGSRAAALSREYEPGANGDGRSPYAPVDLGERRRTPIRAIVAVAAAVAVFVAVAVVRATPDDDDPAPVTDPEVGEGPLRNGSIVAGEGVGWPEGAVPPRRPDGVDISADGNHHWDAFDRDTGSFLFASDRGSGRVWVFDEDGDERADFVCAAPANCGGLTTFGPRADEVTAPAGESDNWRSVQIMGLDGAARDTLDISAVITQTEGTDGQGLSDLAWSPDGTRLAVSTEAGWDCGGDEPCEAHVWIFDRDGGEPQLVHTERAAAGSPIEGVGRPNPPLLEGLAWSPDGRTLAVLSAPEPVGEGAWPRLLALRLAPAQVRRADTVYVYANDWASEGSLISGDNNLHFAAAWSPDGTRIAVTSRGGVAEISAENGEVLARHPGVDVHGPLAWLAEP